MQIEDSDTPEGAFTDRPKYDFGGFVAWNLQSDGPVPDPHLQLRSDFSNLAPSPPPVTIKEQKQLAAALIYSNKALFSFYTNALKRKTGKELKIKTSDMKDQLALIPPL